MHVVSALSFQGKKELAKHFFSPRGDSFFICLLLLLPQPIQPRSIPCRGTEEEVISDVGEERRGNILLRGKYADLAWWRGEG